MKRLRAWLLVLAGWATLALFFAVSNSLTYKSTGHPPNWGLSIERSLSDWMIWAVLTPLVASIARRFPLHGRRVARNVAIHLMVGVMLAVATTLGGRLLFGWLSSMWTCVRVSSLAFNLAVYGGVVAAAHGVEYY